ncbi:hypothetical protein [Pseudomonas putida]|uniref:Uncharacterized protein n=1 Tax=Pseudomonas putida TaxID=303 RepID=A0A8I1EDD9_PSEPU|nr:hypothetical protein [Pseudomonas putida]MBI6883213.1 hypothetical protein [Pseudomonas putida]
MNAEQYDTLKAMMAKPSNPTISVNELDNPGQDRTLLWGYTLDRSSFHVYIKDGVLHRVVYGHPNTLISHISGEELACESMAPDKRAYPAACDEQFSRLMHEKGQHVRYTTFTEREDIPFHGLVSGELVA